MSTTIDLVITDADRIKRVVVEPFARAQLNARPHTMTPLGLVVAVYDDGSEDNCLIFAPWGNFDRGDSYGVTDLSLLREECQRLLRQSPDPCATELLQEPTVWR